MWNVKNTMHLLEFGDSVRGIHGAVLAEVLHCLQLGIFQYSIEQLFLLKKLKRVKKKKKDTVVVSNHNPTPATTNDDEEDDDDEFEFTPETDPDKISTHWCFPDSYKGKFEDMCVFYGAILNHQSDRSLPRTKFNSKYMAVTKKNGHEMAGLIIVFLVVLNSDEGKNLDNVLGPGRCGAFIQCLELLLMLEDFCKTDTHKKNDLKLIKEIMPVVLETIKTTINRQKGCGLKVIKFHLISHFVDDIRRFGSMNNFDSAIGERNHITEVKQPANRTQRRKDKFEEQTADRYVENISINVAFLDLNVCQNIMLTETSSKPFSTENKRKNIYYNYDDNSIYKFNSVSKKNHKITNCKDHIFMNQLITLCKLLIDGKHVLGHKIPLFTQHNRVSNSDDEKNIFRADPFYNETGPWYDWAYVDWDEDEPTPAKLLIFIDLTEIFIKWFKVGDCYVTEKGHYAIAYSFQDNPKTAGHLTSSLVLWGTLIPSVGVIDNNKLNNIPYKEHKLCILPVDSIESTCIAMPFIPHQSIIIASQWLILIERKKWYKKFIEKLNDYKRENN